MLIIAKKLFNEWNLKNIKYCHWKSNEHLIDGLNGLTDNDVLVSVDDKVRCEKILTGLGYLKFIPQVGSRYPNVDEWLGYDNETGKLIHVHLHYELITGKTHIKEYVFPWSDIAFSTCIKDENTNVYVISPNLEIIILYSRIVLKARQIGRIVITEDYFKEIQYLKQRINKDEVKLLCSQLFKTHGRRIFNIIIKQSPTFEDLRFLRKVVKKELKYNRRMSGLLAFFRHKYFRYTTLFKAIANSRFSATFVIKKISRSNGFSVCFIGPDGSGKSTLSKDVEKWLSWKIECKKFYLGSGDNYKSIFKLFMNKVIKLRKQLYTEAIIGHQTSANLEKKATKSKKIDLLRYLFCVINSYELLRIAKYKLKILKKADKYQKAGGIAVFDRFPQVQFEGINDGPKISEKYRDYLNHWIINHLAKKEKVVLNKAVCYSPTVVLKLMLSPDVSIRRKPDHNFEDIKRKAEITEKLIFEKSNIYDIDAAQPYDRELLEVKSIIWKAIGAQS